MKVATIMTPRFFPCLLMGLLSVCCELSAAEWTQQTTPVVRPTGYPAGYTWDPNDMKIVYDSRRHVTVGIGGFANPPLVYLPVSEYDGTQWVSRSADLAPTSPSNRTIGGVVFDSVRGVTVVVGGYQGGQALNEILEYDGTAWSQRTWSGTAPASLGGGAMCFDPNRGRIICLTSSPVAHTYETWEWTGSAWEHGPDLTGITAHGAKMVFDIARNRAFVYGLDETEYYEHVWEYTPGVTAAQGSWSRNEIDTHPPVPGNNGVALVYHPRLRSIFIIGGEDLTHIYSAFSSRNYAKVWNYRNGTWDFFPDDTFPIESARSFAEVCYDDARGVIEVYRGIRHALDAQEVGYTVHHTDMWEWDDHNPTDTWVDFSFPGSSNGSFDQPWRSLTTALGKAPVGGTIYLKPGSSTETLNSNFRSLPVTLRAASGPVTIGRP